MSLKFRLTETENGVWIYGDITDYYKTKLLDMPVWNSYNSVKNEWVIKRKDLPKLIGYLRRNRIQYDPLGPELVKSCNINAKKITDLNSSNTLYICHPITGRWVKRSGFIGTNIIEKYPETVLLPPYKVPTTDEMIENFDNIKLDTVCAYFLDNMLTREAIIQKRDDIGREWLRREFINESRLKQGDLTSENLIALFELIDREFFNSKIQEYLIQTKRHITVIASDRTNLIGEYSICENKSQDSSESGQLDSHFHECVFKIHINIQNVINAPIDKLCLQTPDFDVCSRLVYLQLILENEIARFISLVFCNKQDHETLYSKLLLNMFGQSVPPPVYTSDGIAVNVVPMENDDQMDISPISENDYTNYINDDESPLSMEEDDASFKNDMIVPATDYTPPNKMSIMDSPDYFAQLAAQDAQFGGAGKLKKTASYKKQKHQIAFQWASPHVITTKALQMISDVTKQFNGTVLDNNVALGKIRFNTKSDAIAFGKIISRQVSIPRVKYVNLKEKTTVLLKY